MANKGGGGGWSGGWLRKEIVQTSFGTRNGKIRSHLDFFCHIFFCPFSSYSFSVLALLITNSIFILCHSISAFHVRVSFFCTLAISKQRRTQFIFSVFASRTIRVQNKLGHYTVLIVSCCRRCCCYYCAVQSKRM